MPSLSRLPLRCILLASWIVLAAWPDVGLRAADGPSTVAPGGNLILDGVPPVPAEIVEQVGRYGEARSATFADWHPTRPEMLVLTRFGDTPQVHLVKMPGGARSQLTFFPDKVEAAAFEPTRGDYFVFNKGVGGAEFFQNFRFDMNSGAITLLTDGKSRNSAVKFSRDGRFVAYTSTRRNGADTDIYTEDPLDPASEKMLAALPGGGWEVLNWSPDGKRILAIEGISVQERYLWLIDAQTGERQTLTPRPAPGAATVSYAGGAFSADGASLYTTTDLGGEFRTLVRMDVATQKLTPLMPAQAPFNVGDVENFSLSRDGKRLVGVLNEGGLSRMFAFDFSEAQAPVSVVLRNEVLKNAVIGGVRWRPDGGEVAFTAYGARLPGDVFTGSADPAGIVLKATPQGPVAKLTATRWTTSETGGLNPAEFAEPSLVRWKSFDGREITGFLYAPDPGKFPGKRPVIVNIHGGPESQVRPAFQGRNSYLINELGCAVVYPNVRGSTGQGKTFMSLDNGFKREDAYRDVDALLDWIGTQPGLDAGRIMVTGGSYGGHMVLAVSAFYADKIRCSLDVVGISNLRTYLEHTESYRRDLRRVEYGDERDPKMAEFMERIAPMNNAVKMTKPMFVVQGYNDPRVPRSEAEQMVATLKKQGTPVWFLMARDEGHGFAKKKNADFQFYATVAFVRQYLLGGE